MFLEPPTHACQCPGPTVQNWINSAVAPSRACARRDVAQVRKREKRTKAGSPSKSLFLINENGNEIREINGNEMNENEMHGNEMHGNGIHELNGNGTMRNPPNLLVL